MSKACHISSAFAACMEMVDLTWSCPRDWLVKGIGVVDLAIPFAVSSRIFCNVTLGNTVIGKCMENDLCGRGLYGSSLARTQLVLHSCGQVSVVVGRWWMFVGA